jgi:hypothetical protein
MMMASVRRDETELKKFVIGQFFAVCEEIIKLSAECYKKIVHCFDLMVVFGGLDCVSFVYSCGHGALVLQLKHDKIFRGVIAA